MSEPLHDHQEYRGLLAAVMEAPADDLPRLVLADWLEEHDQPDWAEFIRAQCELDRHPHAARIRADLFTDAEGVRPEWQDGLASARRMRELWPAVSAVIAGMLTAGTVGRYSRDGDCIVVQGQSVVYEVRRGFPSAVRCRLADWFGEEGEGGIGPRLVREHPIERVVVTDREPWQLRGGWAWSREDGTPDNELFRSIPRELFAFLPSPHALAPTPAAAHAALSAAAIAWAAAQSDGA